MYQSIDANVTLKISATIPGPAKHAHVLRVTIVCSAILRERPLVEEEGKRSPDRKVDDGADRKELQIQIRRLELDD